MNYQSQSKLYYVVSNFKYKSALSYLKFQNYYLHFNLFNNLLDYLVSNTSIIKKIREKIKKNQNNIFVF